jgi:FkbM family methyltransferase
MKTVIKKTIKSILPYGIVLFLDRARTRSLYKKIRERAEAVAELLADERSKEIYLGIFRARFGQDEFANYYTKQAQYFENEYFTYGEDDFLLDCGGFIGDTIDDFIKFIPNYKGIISFEPTPASFEILKKRYGDNPKIKLVNKGIWSEVAKLSFYDSQNLKPANSILGPFSHKKKKHTITIDVTSIDALNLQEKVTLIKMDIEGAELEALKGAKETILRDKPKLAICLYHSNEDMIRIPEYIREILPDYKLYVKHYCPNTAAETVLYGCV